MKPPQPPPRLALASVLHALAGGLATELASLSRWRTHQKKTSKDYAHTALASAYEAGAQRALKSRVLVHRHARMSDDVEAVLEEDGDRHLPDLRAEEAGHVFDDAPEAELSKLAVAERTLEEPRREEDVRSQVEPARELSSWGLRGLNRRVALHAIDATSARWRGGAGLSPLIQFQVSGAALSQRNDALVDFHTDRRP